MTFHNKSAEALGNHHNSFFICIRMRLLLIASFVVFCSCQQQLTSPGVSLSDETAQKIEDIVLGWIEAGPAPGVAVCAVKGEDEIYSKGFGLTQIDGAEEVTDESIFHMASISKTFVGTAIMQLVEAKKIDLDQPVIEYLPYFELADARYKDITVRMMLSHTSGIPNVSHDAEPFYKGWDWDNPQFGDDALEEHVKGLSKLELLFEPGTSFFYSDLVYNTLGDVIAKVTGSTFEDYVRDNILLPTGMSASDFLQTRLNEEDLVSPHVFDGDSMVVVSEVYPYNRVHAPSSTLRSNCRDMMRWAMIHLNKGQLDGTRILSDESYAEMWKPHVETGYGEEWGTIKEVRSVQEYALGWELGMIGTENVVGHAGGDHGFSSQFFLAPSKDLGVIAMANWLDSYNGPFIASQIAIEVMEELIDQDI